jgi:prepilin-type N-terminal cleavage/methylation domain-containing protein
MNAAGSAAPGQAVGWVAPGQPTRTQGGRDSWTAGAPSGFTLLETLVALAIVALGFAYAFGAMPESLGAQDRARNLETATTLAQSILAQAAPADGATQKFAWHIDTAPLDPARPTRPGDFAGETERVRVRWTEGRQIRSITLQTIRLGIIPSGS